MDKFISPAGMRMLWMAVFLIIAVLVIWVRIKYIRYKKDPFRIRKKMWYSGGLKMSVSIRNKSKAMVEIDAPVIEFKQPRMKKRRFKIVPPGESKLFPLGLAPQTGYEFIVEFVKLYDHEPILRQYQQASILIESKGKRLSRKKIKIKTKW